MLGTRCEATLDGNRCGREASWLFRSATAVRPRALCQGHALALMQRTTDSVGSSFEGIARGRYPERVLEPSDELVRRLSRPHRDRGPEGGMAR